MVITLPALVEVDINGAPVPVAFFAVVSIGVVGLYVCFAIPIFLRWRMGDSFKIGSWNLGRHYKWLAPVALIEIVVTSIVAMFPTNAGGMPWDPSFAWKFVNYTPLLVGGALIAAVDLLACLGEEAGSRVRRTPSTRPQRRLRTNSRSSRTAAGPDRRPVGRCSTPADRGRRASCRTVACFERALVSGSPRPVRTKGHLMADHPRNPRLLSVDDLRTAIGTGEIDTVVVAFTDMQGRLQGKRLHAAFFLDEVLEHGTEGCNYLLAVDVEMNTVPGYAISSWDKGYGDMMFDLDLDTIRRLTHLPGTVLIQCDLTWLDGEPVNAVAADGSCVARSTGRPSRRLPGVRRNRAGVHRLRGHLRGGLGRPLHRAHPGQPVQRRLLDPRHDPGGAAAARHPQHDVRRRH